MESWKMESIEIQMLSPMAFTKIGGMLDLHNSIGSDWKHLSFYCLGCSHIETKAIEDTALRRRQSPTHLVLEEWVRRQASACVYDFICHLRNMDRHDVIKKIEELWTDGQLCDPTRPQHQMVNIANSSSWSVRHTNGQGRENGKENLTTDCLSNVVSNVNPSPCQAACQLHCTCAQEHPHSSFSIPNPYSRNQNNTKKTSSEIHISQYSNNPSPTSYSTWPNRQTPNIPKSWSPGRPAEPKMHLPVDAHPQVPTLGPSTAYAESICRYDGPGLMSFVQNGPVFITYSAASSKYIQNIHRALQMAGYSVLSDVKRSVLEQPESKTTEVEFQTMLTKGVENCQYVLCLLCEEYMHELKETHQSKKLMNIQFINRLMEIEFGKNGKKNERFIPLCLSQKISFCSLPPYLMNSPVEIQNHFVTLINEALAEQNSNLVIHRVNVTKNRWRRYLHWR